MTVKECCGVTKSFWSKLRFGFQNPTKQGRFVGASKDGLARVLEVAMTVAPALFKHRSGVARSPTKSTAGMTVNECYGVTKPFLE